MSKRKLVIHIVCHSWELEAKSLLLACSIRYFLWQEIHIRFAIPDLDSEFDKLNQYSKTLIKELNIECLSVHNDIDPEYKIWNKVVMAWLVKEDEEILILDSDILVMESFDIYKTFHSWVMAKPADNPTFSNGDEHMRNPVYKLFDIPVSQNRMKSTYWWKDMLQYFNAWVIYSADYRFWKMWNTVCKKIDKEESIENKRPWLDQIALPVVFDLLKAQKHTLTEELNFPAHIKKVWNSSMKLCHYHRFNRIWRQKRLSTLVKKLFNEYEHLGKLFEEYELSHIVTSYPYFSKIVRPKIINLFK